MSAADNKIIFLYSAFCKGGIEKVLCQVANTLSSNYQVTVVAFKVFDKLYYESIKNSFKFTFINLDCYSFPAKTISSFLYKVETNFKGAGALKNVLDTIKPDKIICLDSHGIFWASILKEDSTTGIYMWWHFNLGNYKSFKSWFWKKFIFKIVSGHIALNKAIAEELRQEFPKTKVLVIYNMVDTTTNNFVHLGKNFIYVGRLNNNPKRLDRLFKALVSLNRGDWYLQIVGDGQDRQFLEDLAKELSINDKIIWSGWQKYPWQAIDSANFGILSSDYEGSPLAIAEGIYHGLPYICMNCPVGPSEIIKEGINGILVPLSKNEDENIQNLSLTLQKALEGKIKIGTQSEIRKSVMQFTPEKIVKDWIKLLETS